MSGADDSGADDPAGKPKPAKPFPPLDLAKLIPKLEVQTAVGDVTIRQITFNDIVALQEADRDQKLDAAGLVRALVERTVTLSETKEPLRSDDVAILAADPAFWEDLIRGHPELRTELGGAVASDSPAGRKAKRQAIETLVRKPDERADDFLLRGWRDYDQRTRAQLKGIGASLQKAFGGLTSALSDAGLESLAKSKGASERLQEMIDKATVTRPPYDPFATDYRGFDPIPIPPNPIHETNEHLNELVGSMEQLRELAIETAKMQRGLNEVATEILDKFVTGTEAAERASAKNLGIAKLGLWIAVASVVVTLAVSIFQLATSGPSQSDTNRMTRMEKLSRSNAEQSARQSQMLGELVAIERMQLEWRERERKAAGVKETRPTAPNP